MSSANSINYGSFLWVCRISSSITKANKNKLRVDPCCNHIMSGNASSIHHCPYSSLGSIMHVLNHTNVSFRYPSLQRSPWNPSKTWSYAFGGYYFRVDSSGDGGGGSPHCTVEKGQGQAQCTKTPTMRRVRGRAHKGLLYAILPCIILLRVN